MSISFEGVGGQQFCLLFFSINFLPLSLLSYTTHTFTNQLFMFSCSLYFPKHLLYDLMTVSPQKEVWNCPLSDFLNCSPANTTTRLYFCRECQYETVLLGTMELLRPAMCVCCSPAALRETPPAPPVTLLRYPAVSRLALQQLQLQLQHPQLQLKVKTNHKLPLFTIT